MENIFRKVGETGLDCQALPGFTLRIPWSRQTPGFILNDMDDWRAARSMMTDAVLAKLLGVEAIDGYASGREPTPSELGTRLNNLLALIGDLEGVQTRCTVETRLDALSAPVYWWVEGDASGRSQVREGPRTF